VVALAQKAHGQQVELAQSIVVEAVARRDEVVEVRQEVAAGVADLPVRLGELGEDRLGEDDVALIVAARALAISDFE
jgi:hypothetical protein